MKIATERSDLNKKLAQVETEFRTQVEEERIRNGPEAAERYQQAIAADEQELQNVLYQWATEEL